jgi:hypothetical protein
MYTYVCLEAVISWDIFSEGPLSELYVGSMVVYIYSEPTYRIAKHQLHHNTFYSVTCTTVTLCTPTVGRFDLAAT